MLFDVPVQEDEEKHADQRRQVADFVPLEQQQAQLGLLRQRRQILDLVIIQLYDRARFCKRVESQPGLKTYAPHDVTWHP
jgi:hypothetical protein